jgi:hypothetical protein
MFFSAFNSRRIKWIYPIWYFPDNDVSRSGLVRFIEGNITFVITLLIFNRMRRTA